MADSLGPEEPDVAQWGGGWGLHEMVWGSVAALQRAAGFAPQLVSQLVGALSPDNRIRLYRG